LLTVQEDGRSGIADFDVLERACELGRILFTQDDDFLSEVVRRQQAWLPFTGVLYAHPRTSIAECVEDLELIAKAMETEELASEILYLPL
jgi:predicted nuclease of predicted toxin-antitoxin system